MSEHLKKIWFTDHGASMVMMSLEVKDANPGAAMPHCRETTFPNDPSPEHPLRRTMAMGLFSASDLRAIRNAIDECLKELE